jgi:hypothetical protein
MQQEKKKIGNVQVDDKVANRAEEVVLVHIPVHSTVSVWVGIDDRNTAKVRARLQRRRVLGVTNELSVVPEDNGGRDDVGSK